LSPFSDGIVEASDFSGAEFGERRLIDAVRSRWQDSAEEVRDSVLNSVNLFTGEDHVSDDRTLLVVRFTKSAVRTQELETPEVHEYQLV
jgi:serine phosphatase RsbU (regulator of sigma subunit)